MTCFSQTCLLETWTWSWKLFSFLKLALSMMLFLSWMITWCYGPVLKVSWICFYCDFGPLISHQHCYYPLRLLLNSLEYPTTSSLLF